MSERRACRHRARRGAVGVDPDDLEPDEQVLPGVKNVIAVASGKGGVGKSTMAVNIAAGLSALGARVGLFDADVYGPNVPRMVSAEERPQTDGETIVPPERFGVKLMSMDFLTGEDDPVIWRGPMVHKIITQLVEDVEWGELDYLVMDLPPGDRRHPAHDPPDAPADGRRDRHHAAGGCARRRGEGPPDVR